MGTLFVDKLDPQSGTSLELGSSGDTVSVPSGAELKSNKISPASGTSFTLGDSGDTFTIPSGVTFANSGTATGFGDSNPAFRVYNGGQDISNGGTQTKIQYTDSGGFDTANQWDNSTYKYTISSGNAGKYYFFMHVSPRTSEDDDDLNIAIKKNGAYDATGAGGNFRWTNTYFNTGQMFNIMDMAVGDYVEFFVWHYLSATKTFGASGTDQNFAGGFRLTT